MMVGLLRHNQQLSLIFIIFDIFVLIRIPPAHSKDKLVQDLQHELAEAKKEINFQVKLHEIKIYFNPPRRSIRTQCRQRLATAATFLRVCVAQPLSHGDGLCHSLQASA